MAGTGAVENRREGVVGGGEAVAGGGWHLQWVAWRDVVGMVRECLWFSGKLGGRTGVLVSGEGGEYWWVGMGGG